MPGIFSDALLTLVTKGSVMTMLHQNKCVNCGASTIKVAAEDHSFFYVFEPLECEQCHTQMVRGRFSRLTVLIILMLIPVSYFCFQLSDINDKARLFAWLTLTLLVISFVAHVCFVFLEKLDFLHPQKASWRAIEEKVQNVALLFIALSILHAILDHV